MPIATKYCWITRLMGHKSPTKRHDINCALNYKVRSTINVCGTDKIKCYHLSILCIECC